MCKEHLRVVAGCSVNILASIGIIFLNKYIFSHCQIKTMTLTAIQMFFTSLGLVICLKMRTFARKSVPLGKVLPLAMSFCAFVVFTNLSLEYNTIGTYQLFKVLTTPVVALISWQFYGTKYSTTVILTLVPVVLGVCTHSVNDFKLTLLGTAIASIGVLAASLYQVWVGERLKELDMNSQQLLYYQAPLSAVLLVPFIVVMETLPSYRTAEERQSALTAVIASGIVAFAVNLSVYWVIKNTLVSMLVSSSSFEKSFSVQIGVNLQHDWPYENCFDSSRRFSSLSWQSEYQTAVWDFPHAGRSLHVYLRETEWRQQIAMCTLEQESTGKYRLNTPSDRNTHFSSPSFCQFHFDG